MVDLFSTADEKPMPWVRGLLPQPFGNALSIADKQAADLSGFSRKRPPNLSRVVNKTVAADALELPIRLADVRVRP
jgi:hypothetical protein